MRVAVLGATGMLGSMVVRYLSQRFNVVATARNGYNYPGVKTRQLDILKTDDAGLLEVIQDCQWVINAIGAIPQRKIDPSLMVLVNGFFPTRLAMASQKTGIKVIQIATDCVYAGDKGGYVETNKPDNDEAYGRAKYLGEVAGINHLRCSIIGIEPQGYSLLGWLLSQPKGATVTGYSNHFWNGITTLHFAKICNGIIEHKIDLPHTQHIVPADSVSKAELLGYFKKSFNRQDINILSEEQKTMINRTLSTRNKQTNGELWRLAGYESPPTIEKMVKELVEYIK